MEYKVRLKYKYKEEVVKKLSAKYKSVMQVPKLVKICLNQGIGSSSSDKKQIEAAQNEMSLIAGQKAVLTKSKKDISNFKLRKGMPVGVMVTLRGDKMYEFLDRLITSALPRVRDFNGIPRSGFDGRGNYTLGIKEQIAFPEISIDKINKVTGMDITFVTDTDLDKDALDLLIELGLPFKKDEIQPKVEEKLVVDNKVVDETPVEEVADKEASDDEAPVEEVADEEASDDEAPVEEVFDEESLDKKNIEDKKE